MLAGYIRLTVIIRRACSEGEDGAQSKRQLKNAGAKTAALKAELKAMLAQPLVARGVSTRYITSGTVSIADEMIAGECASDSLLFFLSFRVSPSPTSGPGQGGQERLMLISAMHAP